MKIYIIMAIATFAGYGVGIAHMILRDRIKKRDTENLFVNTRDSKDVTSLLRIIRRYHPTRIFIQESDCQGQLECLRIRYAKVLEQLKLRVLEE